MTKVGRLTAYAASYVLLMSLQYQFAKDGLRFAAPLTFMGFRYLIIFVIALSAAHEFRLILNRDTLILSLFTWMSTLLWILGLEGVSPAQSAVLSYTMPLFAVPLSALILRERTSRLCWAGTVIGFMGVTIYGLQLTATGGTSLGAIFSASNAAFWALFTIYYRKVRLQDMAPTMATQFLIGAVLFFLFMPLDYAITVTPEFLFDLGYVSLLSGFAGFFLWNAMARIETIGRLTTVAFAVPATTILLEALETGYVPNGFSILGFLLMFLGIYLSRIRAD